MQTYTCHNTPTRYQQLHSHVPPMVTYNVVYRWTSCFVIAATNSYLEWPKQDDKEVKQGRIYAVLIYINHNTMDQILDFIRTWSWCRCEYTVYSTTVTAVKTSSTNLINIKLFKKKEKSLHQNMFLDSYVYNTERVGVESVGIGREAREGRVSCNYN